MRSGVRTSPRAVRMNGTLLACESELRALIRLQFELIDEVIRTLDRADKALRRGHRLTMYRIDTIVIDNVSNAEIVRRADRVVNARPPRVSLSESLSLFLDRITVFQSRARARVCERGRE